MKPKQWFVFIALGLIWSSSFLWIKIAVQEVGPITLVSYRVLFGLLFGVVMILIQRVSLSHDIKVWTPLLILGISNIAIPFFLISWGEQSINSGVAAILDATVPLFSVILAHFLLKDDKMTLPKVLGLLIGFIGVIVLMSKDIGGSSSSLLGQGAVILACAFYAGSGIYARKNTENTPGILRSAGPLISATLVMFAGSFLFESPVKVPHLQITWIALLWLGILGSGLAFVMSYYLIHEIGPTRTSMVTYTFPLGGVILGFIFLNESLSWQLIVGGVLIIASLIVTNWTPANKTASV